MLDKETLLQMFKDSILVKLREHNKKFRLTLKEPNEKNSSATIYNVPEDTICIKADLFTSPKSVFKGKNGECKRADFIVVSPKKQVIIYIEMKKNRLNTNNVIKQLSGAMCFLHYCRIIGATFWDAPDFLKNYKEKYVAVTKTSIGKTSTRRDKKKETPPKIRNWKIGSSTEKVLTVTRPQGLQFDSLLYTGEK